MGWFGEEIGEPSHRWQLKPVQRVSSLQESTWNQRQSSGQHLNISLQKVGREREARGKEQGEMFQALEDDKAKVGPGKSRHVSRSGAVIRVDVERASKL